MLRAITAISILALTITTAQAAPVTDIKFSDLNLSNPADARVLETRVHQAANMACAPLRQSSNTSLYYRVWFENCMRATSIETTRWVEARADRYRALARN